MLSTSGDRPPCTQRTAPVELPLLPPLEDVAPVPGLPLRVGVWPCEGDEGAFESWERSCELLLDSGGRAKRLMMWPEELRISISRSEWSTGFGAWVFVSMMGASVGVSSVVAPMIRAPRAR